MKSPSQASFGTSFTDPVHFASDMLRSTLWRKQRDIMRAVATKPLVAVKACHASGKTYQAARLALWWLLRYPEGKVINTAPSWRQVKLMWDEIRLARKQSRIAFPVPKATELRLNDNNYIQGISTNEAVKFQGIHGRKILVIVDEAPGVRADIWDAIEGVRAGGDVHVLMLGNPVIPSGYFFNAFGRGRTIWHTFTIGAFDTPNLAVLTLNQIMEMQEDELSRPPLPYLITPRWVRERALTWGLKHPMFEARVLGQFPSQATDSVFSLEWIEMAKRDPTAAELEQAKTAPIQVGIDVAGPGEDETVLVARSGGIVLELHSFSDADPRGKVVQILGRLRATGRLQTVLIDSVGIGYNFAQHIADSVNEKPSANAPDLAQKLPESPSRFEVASIRLSQRSDGPAQFSRPGTFDIRGGTLRDFIAMAWGIDIRERDKIMGGPAWLDTRRFDVLAKEPADAPTGDIEQDPQD